MGSKSGQITPADGEAFFTSAIRATDPRFGFFKAPKKSRCPPRELSEAFRSATETVRAGKRPTSRLFSAMMVSRMVTLPHPSLLAYAWLGNRRVATRSQKDPDRRP